MVALTRSLTSADKPVPKNSLGTPTVKPLMESLSVVVKSGTSFLTVVESKTSWPQSVLRIMAESSTVLVNGPIWSNDEAMAMRP